MRTTPQRYSLALLGHSFSSGGPIDVADLMADFIAQCNAMLRAVRHALAPEPFMVDKADAARRCSMSPETYDKYARRGLLPGANAVGKISVQALRRACWKLDGLAEADTITDPAERALQEWERL
jgi:hypothetical protein